MSSAAPQGGSRAGGDWTEAARKAYMRLESGREHHGIKIKCPGNLLLYLFLIELRSAMEAADADRYRTALFNIKRAKNDVLSQTYRLVTRQHIMQLSGCKDMLANIIERHLWTLYPPEPEDEEELLIREQAQRAAQEAKKAAAAAKRQESQAAAAAAGAGAGVSGSGNRPTSAAAAAAGSSGVGCPDPGAAFRQPGTASHDPLEELRRILSRDPQAAALYEAAMGRKPPTVAAAAPTAAGAAAAPPPPAAAPSRKRNTGSRSRKPALADDVPTAAVAGVAAGDPVLAAAAAAGNSGSRRRGGSSKVKDYMPRPGTANYAFVITLYLAHRTGTPHMTKQQLIAAADASHLSDVPIQGNNNAWAARQRGPSKWYDGWSNIMTLENREVPLIQRWSNPVKIRLTAAGMMLGALLYRHAVQSGKMNPHEQVPPDEDPPPGSPTAAAGAAAYGGGPGSTTAAAAGAGGVPASPSGSSAAAATASSGAATKSRKTKNAAAAAAAVSARQIPHVSVQPAAAAAATTSKPDPRPSSATPPGLQLDAAVAAAVAAADAAAAAAASYGVSAAAAAAAAGSNAFISDTNWYDDDPCLAGDGYWGAQDCYNLVSDCDNDKRHHPTDHQQQQQQQRAKRRSVSAGSRSKRSKPRQDCGSSSSDDGWTSCDEADQVNKSTAANPAAAAAAAVAVAVDVDVDDGSVATLVAMGFEQEAATQALKLCCGELLDAITYLTELQPSQQQQQQQTQQSAAVAVAAGASQQQQSQAATQQSQAAPQQSAAAAAASAHHDRQLPSNSRLCKETHSRTAAAAVAGSSNPRCDVTDDLYHSYDDQEDYIDDVVICYHSYLCDLGDQEQQYQQLPGTEPVHQQHHSHQHHQQQQRRDQQQQSTCDSTAYKVPAPRDGAAAGGNNSSSRGKISSDEAGQHRSNGSLGSAQQEQQQQHAGSKNMLNAPDAPDAPASKAASNGCSSRGTNSTTVTTTTAAAAAAAAAGRGFAGLRTARTNSKQQPAVSSAAAAAAATGSSSTYVGIDVSRCRPWSAAVLSAPLTLRVPPLGPGQSFADVYDVVLLIDQREQYNRCAAGRAISRTESLQRYADKISLQGVSVDSSVTLACGDVLWVAQHKQLGTRYVLDFVAERKSYDDLSASIIDGRYSHQKWMMAGNAGLSYCMYILEGDAQQLNTFNKANASKALACVTAMHQTLLHDGFKVLETGGPAESVDLLAQITKVLTEMYGPLTAAAAAACGSSVEVLEAWNARISNSRRTKTVRQKWQELLLSVNGIGVEAVHAIVSAYPTPISLFKAYESTIQAAITRNENAVAAARGLLVEVKLPAGQRLGPAKAKVVFDKLFMNGWNLAGEGLGGKGTL